MGRVILKPAHCFQFSAIDRVISVFFNKIPIRGHFALQNYLSMQSENLQHNFAGVQFDH
jgi:hypothetical protein